MRGQLTRCPQNRIMGTSQTEPAVMQGMGLGAVVSEEQQAYHREILAQKKQTPYL